MKIAIVNDSLLAVEAMRRVILGGREHQILWVAFDGAEAVERCTSQRPDLLLMDLIMPRMDGVEATRRIMGHCPCAIVVVTANVDESCSKVFEAMGAGALDALNTPVLETSPLAKGPDILLSKIDTIGKLLGLDEDKRGRRLRIARLPEVPLSRQPLVVIGASAGGPAALAKVLGALPPDFGAGIVVVQHVDAEFARGLADWLAHQTALTVRLARQGDSPCQGTVLLAGTEKHLLFRSSSELFYSPQPLERSYRPSIDLFFRSTSQHWPGRVIALLLTGMGRDGAEGLRALRDRGHHTIAQDQASSAVYGMPKAAAELGAASEILSLAKIPDRLQQLVSIKAANHV